jgi:hypothetical protein
MQACSQQYFQWSWDVLTTAAARDAPKTSAIYSLAARVWECPHHLQTASEAASEVQHHWMVSDM